MTKKMIWVEAYSHSPGWLNGTLADALEKIQNEINEYGPDAVFDYDANFHYDYDSSPSPQLSIRIQREETDEEYAKRVAYENKWKADVAERDRIEYERLKKQFEGK